MQTKLVVPEATVEPWVHKAVEKFELMGIKQFWHTVVNIGVYDTHKQEHKKVKLLNSFCLTWMISIGVFMIFDPFYSQNLYRSIPLHLWSLATIGGVLYLQKIRCYTAARVLFISTLIVVTFVFANFIEPSRMMENFYFVYPLVGLILIDNRKITIGILVLCWLLYYLPYKIIPGIYPIEIFNPVLLLTIFVGCYVILNYSQSLNRANELKLSKANELVQEQKTALEEAYKDLEERKQAELAHYQLKSLKAQMNPHFMFNAMNSIQNLVLKGSKLEAYDYLTKFSSLIRENLNMSEKSFVYLEEELALLQKYLELERLRFRENFEYQIVGTEAMPVLKIPSMIIQPFVENAIKHGLLHKDRGLRRVKLCFQLKSDYFECSIEDNGVGLTAAKEIKMANGMESQSFSTKAIKERLDLLKEYYQTDIGFHYAPIDQGTKVVLRIPYTIEL
ncbi:sensor histidine kinase [Tenacibaculum litopenaei]|uniref:sensor histidine kinase n=1 Tax=Tenacibaculum litopenaei TaxID=396016 RepID=UPI0038B59C46